MKGNANANGEECVRIVMYKSKSSSETRPLRLITVR